MALESAPQMSILRLVFAGALTLSVSLAGLGCDASGSSQQDCSGATSTAAAVDTPIVIDPTPDELFLRVAPNPLRTRGTVSYALPQAGWVRLTVHQGNGKRVKTLYLGCEDVGQQQIRLSAFTLPTGPYSVRLEFNGNVRTQAISVVSE